MAFNPRVWSRKAHRWGAIAVVLPFFVVISTGLLLQLKKQWSWVQPTEVRGATTVPVLTLDSLLAVARSVPEAGIRTWADVDRIDVRPAKGVAKIQSLSRWELQVDAQTGAVLHSAYRRSDLLESIHDGSWFHPAAKLWVFLPAGVIVFALWATGIFLWILPILARRHRAQADAAAAARGVQQRRR